MLAYRSAFSNEVETKWDDDIWTLHTDVRKSLAYFDDFIEAQLQKLGAQDYYLVFSPSQTFRHELCPTYKANRKDKRKPLALREMIEDVKKRHAFMLQKNIEADDLIGIMCTSDPDNTIAVSGDKDFATLPITWYNFLKDELVTRSERDAQHAHLIQTLTGDATDGYAGLKGVGPKTAIKLLDKFGWDWDGVVAAYDSKGQTEEEALLTARLAYILQHNDFNKGEVILWTPNNLL